MVIDQSISKFLTNNPKNIRQGSKLYGVINGY